jgi:hypothetical protein
MDNVTKQAVIKHFGPGRVRMAQCPCCGHLQWISTHTAAPDEVEVGEAAGCDQCDNVYRRNPELATWVANVVRHHMGKCK